MLRNRRGAVFRAQSITCVCSGHKVGFNAFYYLLLCGRWVNTLAMGILLERHWYFLPVIVEYFSQSWICRTVLRILYSADV